MDLLRAHKDHLSNAELHPRFRILKRDTIVACCRLTLDKYFVAFVQDGKEYQWSDVPVEPYTKLVNRLFPEVGLKASNKLHNIIKNVKEFTPSKPGTFLKYGKDSKITPHKMGTIELANGQTREAIVLGTCKPGATGLLYAMRDLSIIFVPDAKLGIDSSS